MNTEGITIEMNSADISQGMQSEDAKEVAEKETDIDDSSSESSDESDTDSAEKNAGDIQDHYSVHDIVQNCCTFAGMEIIDYFDREKTKVGLRVVRGVDWDKGNEDGGEGNIGTVVEVLDDSQQVRVQWDSQETINAHENPDKFIYRTGKDRKYELRLFDNAQT
ncbi:uncharacterized protein LOC134250369, partial [Saccostrea cucullata]|uniref:uncharacterized protein LOC134250369 n=1 Tax=Saccostrea cuccullata TaxID=36930 RepID=UPI002ECFD42A